MPSGLIRLGETPGVLLQGPGEPSWQGAGKRDTFSGSGERTQRQQSELTAEQQQHLGVGLGLGMAVGRQKRACLAGREAGLQPRRGDVHMTLNI